VSRGIALLFLGTRHSIWGWEGQLHVPAASTPGKEPVPIVQEAGCAPRPVWTDEKSLPHRIFKNYVIHPSVHKYNGCIEDISVMYC